MWEDRCFTDAEIIAVDTDGEQKAIPIHRAVLAARSSFFHTLFDRPFRESKLCVVELPERVEIVEAALRHAYTGLVPDVDVLEVMALAHRLGMEDCVVDCALVLGLIPREHFVHVLLGLHLLREHPVVDAAWAVLMQRLCEESDLAESVVEAETCRYLQKEYYEQELQHKPDDADFWYHLGVVGLSLIHI